MPRGRRPLPATEQICTCLNLLKRERPGDPEPRRPCRWELLHTHSKAEAYMPQGPSKIQPPDLAIIARALGGAKRVNDGWRCRCPVHDGHDSNLSLRNGDKVPMLVTCWSHGCSPKDILAKLRRRGLLDDDDRERRRPEAQHDWKPR